MKIGLFAENYYPYICGISPILRMLLHRLKDEGHEVYLVVANVRRVYQANKDNPQIITIDGMKLPHFFVDTYCTTFVLNRKKAVKKLDDMHFDIVHIHGELTIAKLGVEYAKKHHVPVIYTWHSLWKDIMFKTLWVIGYLASVYIEQHNIKYIINHSENYTVPSMKVYKRAMKVLRAKEKPILLPSGIQVSPFLHRDEQRIEEIKYQYRIGNRKVILLLGRISREKRMLTMIRYMKKKLQNDHNLVVVIVGTGYYQKHMEKWAKRHHVRDSVIFTGAVVNRETASFYQLANVFISGSKMETQGLTYIEAMTSGAVVLAQNDSVLEGVIEDGKNGFVFNKKKDFLTKLDFILNNQLDDVRKKAVQKGLEYSSDIYLDKLQKIYKTAIGSYAQKQNEK